MGNQATLNEKLSQGIAAARAGQARKAYNHLTDVLKTDPRNIAALFWLAFVLPQPKDSIKLFERILALDPGNKRAEAGILWAQKRMAEATSPAEAAAEAPAAPAEAAPPAKTADNPLADLEADELRRKLLSGDANEIAEKGPLAQRTRRTFDFLTPVLLLVTALTALMLAALVFVPADSLAAWLPTVTPKNQVIEPAAVAFVKPEPVEPMASERPQNFASETDTILMQLPELFGIEAEAPAPAPIRSPIIVSPDPASFIGPELIGEFSGDEETTLPAENLLLAHQPAYPGEKWIEVNVSTQQITAWEGTEPVMTFIGSTGLPNTPTVIGEFNIYWKLESTLMAGYDYYLPDVPFTMYFYEGYALHGAYWHNNFGQPMSHGCVNLDPGDAQTLFEWADPVIPPGQSQVVASADNPGTLVVVHQ